uniref:Short-chain dehydrogenase n=1 Tax=Brugia timori TaxID=42155 RepID=A0A0R3Q322_9BILA
LKVLSVFLKKKNHREISLAQFGTEKDSAVDKNGWRVKGFENSMAKRLIE